ncbi:MAG TPA: hypothetical protein VHD62_08720 [Opitutaceae bacterium]|nr:hypothetical protein [Opitutaceae bacterium]
MDTNTIVTALLSAATFLKEPIRAVASQSLRDVFDAAKFYLKRKFGPESRNAHLLELATAEPSLPLSRAMLLEVAKSSALDQDADVKRLAETMLSMLGGLNAQPLQSVTIGGDAENVQVVAGDFISTPRHVVRNVVRPDESHLDAEQVGQIRALIADVADRMADGAGTPNFAAVHRQLQRRFGVSSYLLIPRARFLEAVDFLKRQRALHRRSLRRRDPAAYDQDLFRAVSARARELGWDRDRLCQFATEHLRLRRALVSLRELGANQLRQLATLLQRQAA